MPTVADLRIYIAGKQDAKPQTPNSDAIPSHHSLSRCHAGRVVKGVKFQELRDAGDPVACARAYDAQGATS